MKYLGYAKNTLDEWIYFFKNSEIKEGFTAKGLNEAREKLKTINMTQDELTAYKRYLDRLSSEASISQTLKHEIEYKAKNQKAIEIAKEMIHDQQPIDLIVKYTKLNKEAIEKLISELKNNKQ